MLAKQFCFIPQNINNNVNILFMIFIFYSYLAIYYIIMNTAVCIIRGYLCHDKTSYVISYHGILCHNMLYVMTITASLVHTRTHTQTGVDDSSAQEDMVTAISCTCKVFTKKWWNNIHDAFCQGFFHNHIRR